MRPSAYPLISPDWSKQYPTLKTLRKDLGDSRLVEGWNILHSDTALVVKVNYIYTNKFCWWVHIWNYADPRIELRRLSQIKVTVHERCKKCKGTRFNYEDPDNKCKDNFHGV